MTLSYEINSHIGGGNCYNNETEHATTNITAPTTAQHPTYQQPAVTSDRGQDWTGHLLSTTPCSTQSASHGSVPPLGREKLTCE